MPTRIKRKSYGQPYEVTEDIEKVKSLLNGSQPDEWVLLTQAKSGKRHAVKPAEIEGLWETDGSDES